MNLRKLRKHIEFTCGDLAAECMLASSLDNKIGEKELQDLVTRIAVLQAHTLGRLNIKFDKTAKDFANAHEFGKARSAYFHSAYKALLADFTKGVQDIVDSVNKLFKK